MEFDGTLTVLQGTICSLGSRNLLNKEDSLPEVVEALRNVVMTHPDNAKSKIVFFMVLNTNFSEISERLKDDEFVGLFTNITPPIDKAYLVSYVYYLNLHLELFRVIENCPGTLSSKLIDVVIKKLQDPKFHKDEFGLKHFYQLWESVFVKVCKIKIGLHENDHPQKFVEYFSHIYSLIQKILVTSMHMEGLESIVGLHLYYFFKSLLFCIKLHKNPDLSDDPLYKLSPEAGQESGGAKESSSSTCINLIFEKIVNILENLTLDLWMTLSECYLDFDSKHSVQFLIGDVVHCILKEIEGWDIAPDILNCLSGLAINKFEMAGLDEIILNVRNGEKEWFEALIKHPEFTQEKSIKCLIENINLASSDNLDMILKTSFAYISSAEQNEALDLMKDLFLSAIKKTPDHSKWLKRIFENYKPNLFVTPHTQDDLTETFNRVTKDKSILKSELISLCIQSPLETIKKTCHLAVSGSVQVEEVIEVLKVLHYPCKMLKRDGCVYIDYVLLQSLLLEKLTDKEKLSFINLITQLLEKELLWSDFIKNLLKALKTHLENDELETSLLCLEIVKSILGDIMFCIDVGKLLVLLSQVLGHFNWDLKSYSPLKANGRELIASIASLIINGREDGGFLVTDLDGKPWILTVDPKGNEYRWILKEILKSSEVNRICFCNLWFFWGFKWPSSAKLHSYILTLAHSSRKVDDLRRFFNKADRPQASIVLSLTMLLPVLTFPEWNIIFEGLIDVLERTDFWEDNVSAHEQVLDMFGSSLYLLTLHPSGQATYSCYEYALRNFARLVRQVCPRMSAGSIVQILEKIFFLVTAIEDQEERKCCWMWFSSLLLELVDWVKKKKGADAHKNEIVRLLPLLDLKDIAEAIAKRLGVENGAGVPVGSI